MRKLLALLLAISIALVSSACSEEITEQVEEAEGKDPRCSINSFGQEEWRIDGIPFEMNFAGTPAELHDVKIYENYADHGYTFWILISIDRENLTDDDIYWITKTDSTLHKDLTVVAYNTKIEGTKVDSRRLESLGSVYDDQYLYYAFKSDLSRYSYFGETFSLMIDYMPESITNPDGSQYFYSFDFVDDNYSDSSSILTEHEQKVLTRIIVD